MSIKEQIRKKEDEYLRQSHLHKPFTREEYVDEALRLLLKRIDKKQREYIFKWGLEEGGDKLHLVQMVDETLLEVSKREGIE